MITLGWLYILAGATFAAFAALSLGDRTNPRRLGNAAFWGLVATSFFFGDFLGDLGNGILVLCLVGLAGFGALGRGNPSTTTPEERQRSAETRGNRLFLPALVIPAIALLGTLVTPCCRGVTTGSRDHSDGCVQPGGVDRLGPGPVPLHRSNGPIVWFVSDQATPRPPCPIKGDGSER